MHNDDLKTDSSVEWLSIEEPKKSPRLSRKILHRLLMGGAFLLGSLTLLVMAKKFIQLAQSSGPEVSVSRIRDAAKLREESSQAFGEFDAATDPLAKLSQEAKRERLAIMKLFETLELCAQEEDNDRFVGIVDHNRLMKRMEITGHLAGYSNLEKRFLRSELKKSLEVKSYWSRLFVVKILALRDDPSSRMVYAYASSEPSGDPYEMRFLIASQDNTWKLYDWQRMDLGIFTSEEWGLYARYVNTSLIEGYNRWADLLVESDAAMLEGENENAKSKIRLAERQVAPRELADFRWVLAGYRWQALGETSEAERCFLQVAHPEDTPGAYFGLMNCTRWSDPKAAIEYAEKYENTVGPTPELCRIKALMLEAHGRKDQALAEWNKVLRTEPENAEALKSLLLALPQDKKSDFEPHLARLDDPSETIALMAASVGWQDYQGLLYLASYLKNLAPNSPASNYVLGVAQSMDGNYQAAADHYRLAFQSEKALQSEKNKDAIGKYADAYVEAMSAIGQGVAAWKQVPNPKSALETIAYQYEDEYEESLLSEQEFRELVDAFCERFPKSLDGFYHRSQIAIEAHRYEEAEKILRAGLKLAKAETQAKEGDEQEESLYNRNRLSNALSLVLHKLGRTREAYGNASDKKQQFFQLAHLAVSDRRWDDVQMLLELHRKQEPDDPQLHYYTAELAAEEKLWGEAIQALKKGIEKASGDSPWRLEYRLKEISIESNRWLEYYTTSSEPKEAFNALANIFSSSKDWESLGRLIVEHQKHWPRDLQIIKHQANVSWELKNHPAYIQQAEQLLDSHDDEIIPSYQKSSIEDRLLIALVRNGQAEKALELAKTYQRRDSDPAKLAIVSVMTSDFLEAERLASLAAAQNDNAGSFYTHDEVGPTFLSSRFRQLQEKYPVGMLYDNPMNSVIFISEEPWQIDVASLSDTLREMEIQDPLSVTPLKSLRNDVKNAFSVRLENGSLWIATGSGKYDPDWNFADDSAPLAAMANQCSHWLAIGMTALTEPRHEKLNAPFRHLAVQLNGGKSKAFYTAEDWSWEVFPAKEEIVSAWQSSKDLQPFQRDRLSVEVAFRNRDLVTDREFEGKLRQAVRTFQSSPGTRLEVLTCLSKGASLDPLRMVVKSVKRSYGSLQFVGPLAASSELIPELSKGLNVLFEDHEIRAWRLNSEPPVIRVQSY